MLPAIGTSSTLQLSSILVYETITCCKAGGFNWESHKAGKGNWYGIVESKARHSQLSAMRSGLSIAVFSVFPSVMQTRGSCGKTLQICDHLVDNLWQTLALSPWIIESF